MRWRCRQVSLFDTAPPPVPPPPPPIVTPLSVLLSLHLCLLLTLLTDTHDITRPLYYSTWHYITHSLYTALAYSTPSAAVRDQKESGVFSLQLAGSRTKQAFERAVAAASDANLDDVTVAARDMLIAAGVPSEDVEGWGGFRLVLLTVGDGAALIGCVLSQCAGQCARSEITELQVRLQHLAMANIERVLRGFDPVQFEDSALLFHVSEGIRSLTAKYGIRNYGSHGGWAWYLSGMFDALCEQAEVSITDAEAERSFNQRTAASSSSSASSGRRSRSSTKNAQQKKLALYLFFAKTVETQKMAIILERGIDVGGGCTKVYAPEDARWMWEGTLQFWTPPNFMERDFYGLLGLGVQQGSSGFINDARQTAFFVTDEEEGQVLRDALAYLRSAAASGSAGPGNGGLVTLACLIVGKARHQWQSELKRQRIAFRVAGVRDNARLTASSYKKVTRAHRDNAQLFAAGYSLDAIEAMSKAVRKEALKQSAADAPLRFAGYSLDAIKAMSKAVRKRALKQQRADAPLRFAGYTAAQIKAMSEADREEAIASVCRPHTGLTEEDMANPHIQHLQKNGFTLSRVKSHVKRSRPGATVLCFHHEELGSHTKAKGTGKRKKWAMKTALAFTKYVKAKGSR